MSVTIERSTGATAIRPFTSRPPRRNSRTLRARIAATRWPEKETVDDQSQGVQLATMQELARYWATEYDWRKCEARLNALPHFMTEIDGLDIHFIHVRSKHENALPLIITHGWPGSVIEHAEGHRPAHQPTAYGASASDAFDVVIPSMPGYGFSGKPTEHRLGPRPHRPRVGGADEAPRLHPVRGAGRRLGRDHHGPDGRPGTAGTARHPHQHARRGSARGRQRRSSATSSGPATRAPLPACPPTRSARVRAAELLLHEGHRLRARDGGAPADAVRDRRIRPSAWPPG